MDKLKANLVPVMRRLVWRMIWTRGDSQVNPPDSDIGKTPHHPLLGALKGFVRVMPGTDLTKPADPGWGKIVTELRDSTVGRREMATGSGREPAIERPKAGPRGPAR